MSRFYVGQRVRLVGEWKWPTPSPCGQEAVIRKYMPDATGVFSGERYEWSVETNQGRRILCRSSEMEPLTDSYDVTSWDTCVWKPEHLRVGA